MPKKLEPDIPVVKLTTVQVKPGHLDGYLAAQEIWNRETRLAPGCLGGWCGQSRDDLLTVQLMFFWRSRRDLEHWMATDHDRIAALAGADEHYERIEVRVLDQALPSEGVPKVDLR
jgi:quinol monooxygenase YgiN